MTSMMTGMSRRRTTSRGTSIKLISKKDTPKKVKVEEDTRNIHFNTPKTPRLRAKWFPTLPISMLDILSTL